MPGRPLSFVGKKVDQPLDVPSGFEALTLGQDKHELKKGSVYHKTAKDSFQGPFHVPRRAYTDHEPVSSRKDFLDEAVLIGYDGSNMPYVMFYNQIMNLTKRCPYPDRKLPLLRAACVRTAAHTIAIVISDTPGFDDERKINMALNIDFHSVSVYVGVLLTSLKF